MHLCIYPLFGYGEVSLRTFLAFSAYFLLLFFINTDRDRQGQIYKFLNSNIDGYLIDVDLGVSIDIIRKYLINQTDDEFKLISHLESPITGNIDILVKIYQDLINYEKILENEYLHLNDVNKEIVIANNKKFIYEILTFIIKLFIHCSDVCI